MQMIRDVFKYDVNNINYPLSLSKSKLKKFLHQFASWIPSDHPSTLLNIMDNFKYTKDT